MAYIIILNINKNDKNNLQAELQDYLKTLDKRTVEDPDKLFLHLVDKVGSLNDQHTRCKPVTISRTSTGRYFYFEERMKVDSTFSAITLVKIGGPSGY